MKSLLFYVLGLSVLFFSSCRKEQGVDYTKSPYYFYSQDSSMILYDTNRGLTSVIDKAVYKDVTSDAANFSVISKEYGKDSKHIYYTYIALKNVDYDSFYWDEVNELPKDKKRVYQPGTEDGTLKIIRYADPDTYEKVTPELICKGWFRDKNYYFYNHERVDADRETLNFDSPYLPFDEKYVYSVNNGKVTRTAYRDSIVVINPNLLRDSKRYFFKAYCDSTSYIIEYKDKLAFKYYDQYDPIFRIDDKIYYMGILIESDDIDVNSFEVLRDGYSKDKNHVYNRTKVIPDSDPSTFEVLTERYTKDKNNVYDNGSILEGYNPKDFKKDKMGRLPVDTDYGKEPPRSGRSRGDDD